MAKYYGVWIGKKPGIYETWDECKAQIHEFPKAKYKKLEATTKEQALLEYNNIQNSAPTTLPNPPYRKPVRLSSLSTPIIGPKPTDKFLTVDGAANNVCCEYQAVWTTGEKAFASKQFKDGTNNIAEFLGLVEAIKYLNDNNLPLVVYTDSLTAMVWVKNQSVNTTAKSTGKLTKELEQLIIEAINYLKNNLTLIDNTKIIKWETKQWGQIPSDYGRK